MREDENITTDGNSSTVNIEIMTNHDQNEAKSEDNEVKTQVKTSPSLEEVEIPSTKSRGKRAEGFT